MDLVVKVHGEDTLTPVLKKTKEGLNGLGGSAERLEKIKQKFDKITSSAAPLKKRLAETKKLMAELNLDGLSNTDVFNEMAKQAGKYSDALGDASRATKQFANDNRGIQACIDGMSLLTGIAGAASGAMNLLGIENENVQQAMLKVQSVLAVLNSLQAIANVLNKDSTLMLTLKSAATTGATVTTTALTAALSKQAIVEALVTLKQKISTAAQVAWNIAKAIGMALLGNFTGLALVAVGAIVGLAVATKDDTDETEKNNEAKEHAVMVEQKFAAAKEEASKTIIESQAKVIASYKALRYQWQNLTSEQEKAKWIEENASKFNQLGYDIDDTKDAEDFFNKNTDNVVKALQARAKAAALYELYLKALQKQYELNNSGISFKFSYDGDKWGDDYKKQREQAYQHALAERNAEREAQNRYIAKLEKDMNDASAAAEAAAGKVAQRTHSTHKSSGKSGGSKKSGGGSSNKKEEKVRLVWENDDHSLDFAQRYLRQLEDDASKLDLEVATKDGSLEKVQAQILAVKKEIEARKLVLEPAVEFPEGSLEYANSMLTKAKEALDGIDLDIISDEDLEAAKKQVEDWTKEVEKREIKLGIKVEEPKESDPTIKMAKDKVDYEAGSNEDKRASYQNASNMISRLKSDVSIGLIGADEALEQVAELNKQLEELGLKPFKLEIDVETGELKDALTDIEISQQRMQKFQEDMTSYQETFNGFGNTLSSIGSMLDSDSQAILDFGANTITAVAQILPQLMALFGNKAAVAMISGVESASSIPFPGNLAAIATVVATLTGVIASAAKLKTKKYASGGIIGGATTIGDYNLARVNSGEMILNNRQQARLFRMLDSGASTENGVPSYTVKVKGSDIYLALSNFGKTKKKIL